MGWHPNVCSVDIALLRMKMLNRQVNVTRIESPSLYGVWPHTHCINRSELKPFTFNCGTAVLGPLTFLQQPEILLIKNPTGNYLEIQFLNRENV